MALRQAAQRAGLGQPHLVETPVAAAQHLAATGHAAPPGTTLVVCDLGASRCEATVLLRHHTGYDVLATIDDPAGGGTTIDNALATHIHNQVASALAHHAPTPPAVATGTARAVKEALTVSPTVLAPTNGPPLLVEASTLTQLAAAPLTAAARTVTAAIDAAGLTSDAISGVYLTGGGARLPGATAALAEALPVVPRIVDPPESSAVLGAAAATGLSAARPVPVTPAGRPGIGDLLAVVLPALAAIVLALHGLITADRYDDTTTFQPVGFLVTNWGQYAMAALFLLTTCLATGVVLAASTTRSPGTPSGRAIAASLPPAAAAGLTIAGTYATIVAAYFDVPPGPLLKWALLPVLPAAVAASIIGLLAGRNPTIPAPSWLRWLRPPVPPLITAALGMTAVQLSMAPLVAMPEIVEILAARLGAAAIGVAAVLTLLTNPRHRLLAAPLAGMLCAAVISWSTTGLIGIAYVTAVTAWWWLRAARVLLAIRQPGAQVQRPGSGPSVAG